MRLPVDLMPDVSLPEHHRPRRLRRRRPAGDGRARDAAARAGAQRRRRPRAAQLDVVGRLGARHAELRVGHRPQRGGRRRPHPARPRARPAARGSRGAGHVQVRRERRSRSWASASRATTTASRCARSPSTTCRRGSSACRASPRSRSTAACAARFTSSSRRKRSAPSTCRSIASSTCSAPRTRTSRSARSTRATAPTCSAARASSRTSNEIRDLVVMTRTGVPVYLRDIAEVKDSTEDFRSFTRINGKPGVRLRVTKQSGTNTVAIADAVRAEIDRINREMPSVTLTVLDDSSIFISRSIHAVQEHALIGGVPRHADHLPVPAQPPLDAHRLHVDSDLGHRHVRAALLRRLHAEHDDVRRPGARHRHDRRRVDRRAREHVPAHGARQGPDDGGDRRQRGSLVGDSRLDADAHRRVRAAALPDRRLEHPVQAAVGRRHVLADDVAVRGGDDRAGALLAPAQAAAAGRRAQGARRHALFTRERALPRRRWTTATAGSSTSRSSTGRP